METGAAAAAWPAAPVWDPVAGPGLQPWQVAGWPLGAGHHCLSVCFQGSAVLLGSAAQHRFPGVVAGPVPSLPGESLAERKKKTCKTPTISLLIAPLYEVIFSSAVPPPFTAVIAQPQLLPVAPWLRAVQGPGWAHPAARPCAAAAPQWFVGDCLHSPPCSGKWSRILFQGLFLSGGPSCELCLPLPLLPHRLKASSLEHPRWGPAAMLGPCVVSGGGSAAA